MAGLGLDHLQRITNVHWGGKATYVTGSTGFSFNATNDVWTNKIESKTELTGWKKTLSSPKDAGFRTSFFPGSGVCALVGTKKEPMFILGGQKDNAQGPAMFMRSKDGVTWLPTTIEPNAHVYLLTWNETEQALYAGMMIGEPIDPDDPGQAADVALRSVDGISWSEASRVTDPFSTPDQHAVEPYCSNKVHDTRGNKVPTSVFGFDKDKNILIKPEPITLTFGQTYSDVEEYDAYGQTLKVEGGEGAGIKALPAGMAKAWAVAYAAGIWQAAGETTDNPPRGVVATSVDDGKTWVVTLTDALGSRFACVAAGGTKSDEETA